MAEEPQPEVGQSSHPAFCLHQPECSACYHVLLLLAKEEQPRNTTVNCQCHLVESVPITVQIKVDFLIKVLCLGFDNWNSALGMALQF